MKPVKATLTKGLDVGARLIVADNSGAKIAQVLSVKLGKAVKRRRAGSGVGDVVSVSIKQGNQTVKKKVMLAVVIRQKKAYRRKDGTRIKFEDNACVVLKSDEGDPKGTVVKGPVAREVIERFPKIGKISSIVV
ncbi:MAG: uL14 family ribosomal protein [Candidatus Nanoarchaeia archaeon]|nr:uL14 family ribosomal protein [Candidatus Nanoarchaeia archaeon]MDD5053992.1 uL14 family ribosomal protein [Candidatus Nanoarchaeia archaeon]MDD5499786.1 uL14 family ribosomal protein [Candidatus Nanoarchaeia archaeon]